MRKRWKDNNGTEVLNSVMLTGAVLFYYYLRADLKNSDCFREGALLYTNSRWDISLGRWFTPVCLGITGSIVNPLLFLFCYYIFVGVAAVILIDIWGIGNRVMRILTGIVMAVAPAIVGQAMYIHEMPTYAVSLISAFVSVFILTRYSGIPSFLMAVSLFTVSLGCFQSIIGVVVFAILGYLALLPLKQYEGSFRRYAKTCVRCIVFLGLGLGLYWIVWDIILKIMGMSKVKYSGTDKVGVLAFFRNLLQYFKRPVWIFISYYRDDPLLGNFLWIILILAAAVSGIYLIFLCIRDRRLWTVPVVIIMAGLIPFGANIIDIIIPEHGVQLYMTYQMQMLAPFCAALMWRAYDSIKDDAKVSVIIKRCITGLTGVCLAGIAWGYCLQTYSSFRTVELGSEHIRYYIGNALTHALEDDAREKDMPIVFLGFVSDDQVQELNPLHEYSYFDNAYPFWKDRYEVFTVWRDYCIYYFGVDIGRIEPETYESILASPEFLAMEQYPSGKAYSVIDGCYVILMDRATVRE